MTAIPAAIRKAVLLRADGQCERCGAWSRLELHHRLFRSRAGQHTVSNIVALCGWGNHTGCHGWAHTEGILATGHGYQIPSGGNPDELPIRVGDSWFFLKDKKFRCTQAEAERAFAGLTAFKGVTL